MKGYRFVIWLKTISGYWNSNIPSVVIHARNLKEAWNKFESNDEYKKFQDSEKYWIYKVECLGTVKKVVETHFEYTPLVRSKYESRY